MERILATILVSVLFIAIRELYTNYKIKKFWKEWENKSFEFEGGRYSKSEFEVVDGKIHFKNKV